MFGLVSTCIEAHIFVTSCSISHIFISIIQFFCFFLLLGQIFTWNIQHYKTHIQHQLYTVFEQIFKKSCFIFSHTQIQRMKLITRKRVFIFHISGQDGVCIGIGSSNRVLKAPPLSYRAQPCRDWWKMRFMFPRMGYQCQIKIFCVSVEIEYSGLTSRSNQPVFIS